ncbi:hypothetical protein CYY_007799 [Polysphondylium violaceum]|uniref:Glycosyltransferase 2-like domain-containing protein n=1 Tax=Polysphondylium violaceum TaxID=133409 RepID=A0A8J4PQ93_9MYCE|nr:hypothetical protein CYY_007799 [Polysphondylium violaceum]
MLSSGSADRSTSYHLDHYTTIVNNSNKDEIPENEYLHTNKYHPTILSNVSPNDSFQFSIVIPHYNQLSFIQSTMDSVFNQKCDNVSFQVTIVDDGSTEWNTKEKLLSLFKHYEQYLNITVIFNRNSGLSFSRNIGIENSRAEWILPLDSDDMIDSTFLLKSWTLIKEQDELQNNIIIIPGLRYIDYKSTFAHLTQNVKSIELGEWEIPVWNANDIKYRNLLHCSGIYRKSLWKSIGGYNPTLWFGWEDWDFWLRADRATKGIKPLLIKGEPLFNYRLKNGMHSFCKENYQLCFSLFQTIHHTEYSIEDVIMAQKYIGIHGQSIKSSIMSKIKVFSDNSILHFWMALIYQYAQYNSETQKFSNISKANDYYTMALDYSPNGVTWQIILQKSLMNLGSVNNYLKSKKDLLQLYEKNKQLEELVLRIYDVSV